MTTEEKLRGFIVDELQYDGSPAELADDYPLIDNNVIDSLGIYQIVTYIEGEFGVEILDEELVPDHFGTIADMAHLIGTKRG